VLSATSTREVAAVLEPQLRRRLGRALAITALERRPSAYRTSFALEELDITLDDGTRMAMVLKQLGADALSPTAADAKPGFLRRPTREIEVYDRVLGRGGTWAPACYGAIAEPPRRWILLERVPGLELYQVGELTAWCAVARRLAEMHVALRSADLRCPPGVLVRHDGPHYHRFAERALVYGRAPGALAPVLRRYEGVVERLLALPSTFVHGELYASNVLVEAGPQALRVVFVDWETAAWAPGLFDLAALTSGSWTTAERREMVLSYREALGPNSGLPADEREFLDALELCRLHLAVQWLGWSPNWRPPAEHAHDWGADAERLVEELGL
jgi:Ser/Thr protein kinase RdoA (MazF antagonist)